MVIVEINSGLGNQMFQYAAGKSLATYLNTNLQLDISWFKNAEQAQTFRKYELDLYPISDPFADEDSVNKLIRPSSSGLFGRIRHKLNIRKPVHRQWAFIEPHFHFYSDFFQAKKPVFLSGYWQSEKYFLPIANEIRKLYSLNIPSEEKCFTTFKLIANSPNAVSIHVRRGDMVKNPDVAKVHGSCNLEYFENCMKTIEQRVESPEYFVFSDDPSWCKENLSSKFPIHFVTDNEGNKSYLDIQLMRHCKHNIIANSSFSWWGAWLNSNPNKIVIAPQNWFAEAQKDTSDLIPDTWIRL